MADRARARTNLRRGAAPARVALAVFWLLAGGCAAAEPRVAEGGRHYLLQGRTLEAVSREMQRHLRADAGAQGRASHASLRSAIDLDHDVREEASGRCRFSEVRVSLQLSTTLPRWAPSGRVQAEVARAVQRMIEGLRVHEAGHRRNVLAAARAIERRVAALGSFNDCRQAQRAAQRVFRRELALLAVREQRYDQRTAHGRRQGARLQTESIAPRSSASW